MASRTPKDQRMDPILTVEEFEGIARHREKRRGREKRMRVLTKASWRILLVGAAAIAAALTVTFACSSSKASSTVSAKLNQEITAPVVLVKMEDLSNKLQIASEFIPYQEIDVDAEVSGYVKKLNINWGAHVRQHQLMAVLEVPQLDAEVQRDQYAVARDQNDLLRAQQELGEAKATFFLANVTYKRLAGVQKQNPELVAQEEVDTAQSSQLKAAAGVSAAKAAVAAAQQALAADKATLARDNAMFQYSFIRAPFNGVVTRLDAYTGALLPAGTSNSKATLPLCHLAQLDLLRLVIPVPEQIVPDVHLGEPVNVQVPSLNRKFLGKVSVVTDQINLETRTMHTEVEVPNPNFVLVPGMYAYVQLPVRTAAHALALPLQAVAMGQRGKTGTVLVVNLQNQIERRKVRLGIETAYEVQISSGLREGQMVVFGEQGRYHSGEIVRPEPVNLASLGASPNE
jgi:RND family efflux transporter MFP subunit